MRRMRMPGLKTCVLLVACPVALSFPPACSAQEEAPPAILLTEIDAISLPTGFRPTGLIAESPTLAVAWSHTDGHVLLRSDDDWRPLEIPGTPVGASIESDGLFAVVDGLTARVHYFGPAGDPLKTWSLGIDTTVVAAVRGAAGWYVLTPDERLLYTPLNGHALQTGVSVDWNYLGGAAPTDISLTAVRRSLLVTSKVPPFSIIRFADELAPGQAFEPVSMLTMPSEIRTGDGLWVSLATVPMGDRYVQTLFDAQSDRRLLVTYDACGRAVRARSLTAPLSLAASSARDSLVFAIRHADRLELVVYRWTFVSDESPPRPCQSKGEGQ